MGLAAVERIIYWHGGRFWAESEAGCGTTFLFTVRPAVH
jgi:signal transduction histidine kinase